MYTSTEEARSDLFLSGAVYVIGPAVIEIVLNILRLDRIATVQLLQQLAQPVVTTALVPILLMRYRRESFGQYGFGAGLPPNFAVGLLLASPIIVASVLSATLSAGQPLLGLGIGVLVAGLDGVLALIARLLTWLGLGFLGVYATVKARDAFRSDFRTVRDETIRLGRIVAAVAAVAVSIVLLFSLPDDGGILGGGLGLASLLLLPFGVAGSVFLLLRTLRGPSATSAATMLTPVVLLALGPLQLVFDAEGFALTVWFATLFAGVGLVIGALQESRRSALAGLGLALAVALFTVL